MIFALLLLTFKYGFQGFWVCYHPSEGFPEKETILNKTKYCYVVLDSVAAPPLLWQLRKSKVHKTASSPPSSQFVPVLSDRSDIKEERKKISVCQSTALTTELSQQITFSLQFDFLMSRISENISSRHRQSNNIRTISDNVTSDIFCLLDIVALSRNCRKRPGLLKTLLKKALFNFW